MLSTYLEPSHLSPFSSPPPPAVVVIAAVSGDPDPGTAGSSIIAGPGASAMDLDTMGDLTGAAAPFPSLDTTSSGTVAVMGFLPVDGTTRDDMAATHSALTPACPPPPPVSMSTPLPSCGSRRRPLLGPPVIPLRLLKPSVGRSHFRRP
jgi:hypothetical protein